MNRSRQTGRAAATVTASIQNLHQLQWRGGLILQSGGMGRSWIMRRWRERTRMTARIPSVPVERKRIQKILQNVDRKCPWKTVKISMRKQWQLPWGRVGKIWMF